MGFTELSHAFIAAKYYVYLKEIFGDRGEAAFLHATRYYGEQRGRRMAQRAIRDGKPLTYETYCQYGEWVNTEEVKAQGLGNQSETTSLSPDFQIHIHVCPWHTQFKNMGLPEAGLLYCKDLDASISRGFNPEIRYEVSQTLHDHDYCIQTIRNAGLTPESNMAKIRQASDLSSTTALTPTGHTGKFVKQSSGKRGHGSLKESLMILPQSMEKRWQTRWQDMQGRILISQTKKSAALQKELLKYCC